MSLMSVRGAKRETCDSRIKKKEGMNNHWDYIIPHGFINPVRNPSTPTRNDPEEGQSQSPE